MTKCRYCHGETADGTTLCKSPICAAKRELSEYRYKFREAEELGEDVEELLTRIRSCGASLEESGNGGRQTDTFEKQMCKYLDLKTAYEKLRTEAYDEALKIEYKIRELDSPFREILRLKYIKQWTFEKIAVELNYEYRWVIRLYNRALKQYSVIQLAEIDH